MQVSGLDAGNLAIRAGSMDGKKRRKKKNNKLLGKVTNVLDPLVSALLGEVGAGWGRVGAGGEAEIGVEAKAKRGGIGAKVRGQRKKQG